MYYKFNYLFCTIIFFINVKFIKTFNVNFHYNYNLPVEPFNTQIYKRELTQFFDKASFSFNGFQKVESIPVVFPIDICVFSLEGTKYATTLHMKRNGARHFKVLKMNNGSYGLIADIATPNGIAMDCISFNNKGYIAIALNLTEPIQYAKEGSAIYEVAGNRIKAVQYFAASNLTAVYLHASGNDFFLLHTYANSQNTPNLHCPYFKWSGSTFNKIGRIPCSNAHQLAPFSIDYESYVAVANYADQKGRTSTNSEIYKYSRDKKKFVLLQKIQTNGAVDVQYFNVPENEIRRHFLVFGNSISMDSSPKREGHKFAADSVFYLFDKGQFIPYQKLPLYAVKKFLPVQNVETEKFILLVACTDQDIKVYNFNDWKFEESKVQFTEGALGKGVSSMRIYQEAKKSYLIIANNLMADNETNIFFPIFKQEEHANFLRQKIIDWAEAETQRLETVNTENLGKRVEEKIKKLEQMKYFPNIQDISEANIQTVTTESLTFPKLKMSSDYWLALNYINQALDALEIMLKQKQRLKRDMVSSSDSYENLEYIHDTLNVKTLTVHKFLKATRVNRVNSSKPEFKNITAQKVIVNNKYTKPLRARVSSVEDIDYRDENEVMTVKNLQISGKLNEYLFSDLFNNTLKRNEEMQFFKVPIEIETLKTDATVVSNDKVNEQDLGALVLVNGGPYAINQDIQFDAPITVNQLKIIDRLNNINVFNGQLNVLLKKANTTQVIEGFKNVTNIKVVESITVAGKIMGRQLEAISPDKFINESLVLQGNYIITGDAHINHQLNTLDLIDLNEKLSTKQLLDMGIRMDASLKDINLKFQQPLTANSSLVSFVNQHDLQRLVKLNQDDIQVIEGLKMFNDSLEIKNGFSEVRNLNGIDIEKLESSAFLKNNNQSIKVPIKIGKISAQSIQSPITLLNNKNLSDYLTITGNQSIQGSLILENLKAQFLTVEHLNTDSKIFQQNIQDIYQQKSRVASQDVLKKDRKFHGSIYVQNLILNSTINNKPVEVIENQILQLEGNIKYVGNFKFNYPINVTNMTFQGKLNGIKAKEFGKCWLEKKSEKQVFTAPQTFASINAIEGILLQGKLNGFSMEEFYTKTYWINRNEYISCADFENPFEITTHLNTKTLNDYMVSRDVFYKNSKEKPIILNLMRVDENLTVEGSILNLNSINNINLNELHDFLASSTGQTLYVENAYFLQSPPLYKTLNSHYIRQTLDSIWLANENVILPHNVEIRNANFEGLLEFEGSINDINLDYLKENYFSKTKPQNVSVEMVFSKDAEFENEIQLNGLQLFGSLKERKSEVSFSFDEFVHNTVKTSGPHIISGNWSFLEAVVEGNLNDVLINKLSLVDDILHKIKHTTAYQLKAPKIFKSANIGNLYADSSSLVNKVPVSKWIRNAVYLYENYTIKGVTTIDSLNVYNNLIVFGKLNKITFSEHNLLLQNKNQKIPGSVKIVSHLAQQKKFLTNNIAHLYTDYINRQYVPTFMENLIPVAGATEIKSHLKFKHALKVERYDGPEGILTQNPWTKRNVDEHTQLDKQTVHETGDILKASEDVKGYLFNITKNNIYKLDHFDIIQTIEIKSAEIFMLSLKIDARIVDILAVSDMRDKNVKVLKWMPTEKQFRETKEFDWLPHNPLLLKIIQKFVVIRQPIEDKHLKAFISHDLEIFFDVLSKANSLHKYFEFSNQTCMRFENNILKDYLEMHIFCLNAQNSKNLITYKDKVLQIKTFGQKYIALLTSNSVLIYDVSLNSNKILQKIALTKAKQMAFGLFKNDQFLAVLSGGQSSLLNYGLVEIYRSYNSTIFTLFQTLKCSEPSHIAFSFIEKSNDFLIHVLTDSLTKPYLIYQYRGVMGFREVLSNSVLPSNFSGFNILNLYSSKHYFVALNGENNITLVEFALNKI